MSKRYLYKNIVYERKREEITTNYISFIKSSYIFKSPYKLLDNKANKYLNLVSKLETLSPLLTLQRGYTITKSEGKVISSSKKIKKGDKLNIEFSDGTINTEVI